jgi:UDP-N-acetylmuramate dehydrogenase
MDETQRHELIRLGGEDIRLDYPMDEYTTFRVGGKAEIVYFAGKLQPLQKMVNFLTKHRIAWLVVGRGSNLLVKNGGLKGVVIILKGDLAAVEEEGQNSEFLLVGGGLGIAELLAHCSHKGFSGLEFLAGIPGTVGGAIAMNSGAFGNEVGSMVKEIQVVGPQGELAVWNRLQVQFSYRRSAIPEGTIVAKAKFHLSPEDPKVVADRVRNYLARRKETQPLEYPSAGSVFKNPPDDYAGRLIEKVGLKGIRIGGAMISPKHANFIVNTGGARAEDILTLMNLARERVREETGIELEPEIKVVGV